MLWRSVCRQALYSSTKVVSVSSSPDVDLLGDEVSMASSSLHKLNDIFDFTEKQTLLTIDNFFLKSLHWLSVLVRTAADNKEVKNKSTCNDG